MNNLIMKLIAISFVLGVKAIASTGSCSISVNRDACPGRDTEAWYPYQGVNPTSHSLQAKDQAKCVAAAQRMAVIARKDVLKKVTATATYDGSALAPVVSESSCESSSKNAQLKNPSEQRLNKGVVFQGAPSKK